jgi:hypothetical protein
MADQSQVRDEERAIWAEVERLGREARAAEASRQAQTVTRADRDAAAKKPTELEA